MYTHTHTHTHNVYAKAKTWCLWTQPFVLFGPDNKDPDAMHHTVSPQTFASKIKKFIINVHFLHLPAIFLSPHFCLGLPASLFPHSVWCITQYLLQQASFFLPIWTLRSVLFVVTDLRLYQVYQQLFVPVSPISPYAQQLSFWETHYVVTCICLRRRLFQWNSQES